jgi:hypothetical protein
MDGKVPAGAGKRPQPPGGSRKGKPNKITVAVKDAIQLAAEGLGGPDRLIAWAKEDAKNEHAFWTTIYPKLLPLKLSGDDSGDPLRVVQRIERVIIDPADTHG